MDGTPGKVGKKENDRARNWRDWGKERGGEERGRMRKITAPPFNFTTWSRLWPRR